MPKSHFALMLTVVVLVGATLACDLPAVTAPAPTPTPAVLPTPTAAPSQAIPVSAAEPANALEAQVDVQLKVATSKVMMVIWRNAASAL